MQKKIVFMWPLAENRLNLYTGPAIYILNKITHIFSTELTLQHFIPKQQRVYTDIIFFSQLERTLYVHAYFGPRNWTLLLSCLDMLHDKRQCCVWEVWKGWSDLFHRHAVTMAHARSHLEIIRSRFCLERRKKKKLSYLFSMSL